LKTLSGEEDGKSAEGTVEEEARKFLLALLLNEWVVLPVCLVLIF